MADILGSARVQRALRALLHTAWVTATSGAPVPVTLPRDGVITTDGEATATALPANGKLARPYRRHG